MEFARIFHTIPRRMGRSLLRCRAGKRFPRRLMSRRSLRGGWSGARTAESASLDQCGTELADLAVRAPRSFFAALSSGLKGLKSFLHFRAGQVGFAQRGVALRQQAFVKRQAEIGD